MWPSENIIPTSSLFHFPSPYLPYEDDPVFLQNLNDLFTSTDINNNNNNDNNNNNMSNQTTNNNNAEDSTTSTTLDPLVPTQATNQSATKREPKKRSSKKDRHSKINTAHGPRDRRMRLSLDVARKFFSLQDLLGFEKASKTVEWLLTQSKSSIKDLSRAVNNAGLNSSNNNSSSNNLGAANSASSTSECEVLSGTDEPRVQLAPNKPKVKAGSASKDKKRKGLIVRRSAFDSTARELREKARGRARERTTRNRNLQVGDKLNLSRLGCLSPSKNGLFVEVEKPSSHVDVRNVSDDDHEEGSSRDDHVDMIFGDSFWTSSTFFNYHHNSTTSHEIADFQVYGKPWEGYNNCI